MVLQLCCEQVCGLQKSCQQGLTIMVNGSAMDGPVGVHAVVGIMLIIFSPQICLLCLESEDDTELDVQGMLFPVLTRLLNVVFPNRNPIKMYRRIQQVLTIVRWLKWGLPIFGALLETTQSITHDSSTH